VAMDPGVKPDTANTTRGWTRFVRVTPRLGERTGVLLAGRDESLYRIPGQGLRRARSADSSALGAAGLWSAPGGVAFAGDSVYVAVSATKVCAAHRGATFSPTRCAPID
jgi:hypothetical protein